MQGFVGLATWIVTGCLGMWGLIGLAQSVAAPKQMNKDAAKSAVLTSSPACPNISTDAINHQTATEPITVRYDGKAKGALRSAKSLTLHVALPRMSQMGTVQDFPMTQQPDGMWLATVTLTGSAVNSGYVMFDVEDQDHHIDRNGGQYWDSQLCFTNRDAPTNRFPTSLAIKVQSYDGRMMAQGFQRAPDMARALAIVREDFAKYPQNFGDLSGFGAMRPKAALVGVAMPTGHR
jgi:hypothetical protein